MSLIIKSGTLILLNAALFLVSCDRNFSTEYSAVDSIVKAETQMGKKFSRYALIDIEDLAELEVERLKSQKELDLWIEFGDQLLISADMSYLDALASSYSLKILDIEPKPDNLYSVHEGHGNLVFYDGAEVLVKSAGLVILQSAGHEFPQLVTKTGQRLKVKKLSPNSVIVKNISDVFLTSKQSLTRKSTQLAVEEIDMARWLDDVNTLSSFNRYTFGSDIVSSRDWLVSSFCELMGEAPQWQAETGCENDRMEVRIDEFDIGNQTAWNVVATFKGRRVDADVYIVGAHYDSISESPYNASPGVEDNATGTAALLEMARVFSQFTLDDTLIFVAYSGEEQGLKGSKHHVSTLLKNPNRLNVRGVYIMDMIGYTKDEELNCVLEISDTEESTALKDHLAQMAKVYARDLRLSWTTQYWGSDHEPYLDAGFPGFLAITRDYDDYPYYHSNEDVFENRNSLFSMMARQIIRMNTASLAERIIEDSFVWYPSLIAPII